MDEFQTDLNESKSSSSRRQRPHRPAAPPQRSQSEAASEGRPPSRPTRQRSTPRTGPSGGHQHGLQSKSEHQAGGDSTDDWFNFGESDHKSGGDGFGDADLDGSFANASFHNTDDSDAGPSGRGVSRTSSSNNGRRPGMARGLSERRMEFKQQQQQLHSQTAHEPRSKSPPMQRGVARSRSGVGGTRMSRHPPTRTRSDAMSSAKRAEMLAMYRSNHDEKADPAASTPPVGSGLRERPARNRPPARTKSSGLEAGALSAMIDRRPPMRSKSTDLVDLTVSAHPSLDSKSSHHGGSIDETDPKWLERRANKQDEIEKFAKDIKDRFHEERERQEELEYAASTAVTEQEGGDLDDDDQPMAMGSKKTVLDQLKKVANKTGAGARSLGKGTVNAISDPKTAAKRFGHLSKDVGKATIKTALDPKKMAKATKSVTVGSAKIGAGLTNAVAKTTYGASKAVVKGGVSATASGAKLTMKGTKKVVRAVKGKDKHKHKDGENDYNARTLADRNQNDFLGRITSLVETNTSVDDDAGLEDAILAGIAAAEGETSKQAPKAKGSSVLMPIDLVGPTQGKNWDVGK